MPAAIDLPAIKTAGDADPAAARPGMHPRANAFPTTPARRTTLVKVSALSSRLSKRRISLRRAGGGLDEGRRAEPAARLVSMIGLLPYCCLCDLNHELSQLRFTFCPYAMRGICAKLYEFLDTTTTQVIANVIIVGRIPRRIILFICASRHKYYHSLARPCH